jgi:hypothetical protein
MSNKRWNSNEKIELMKLFSTGISYDEIGKKLDRSPNAIKLRIESIVYKNLEKGKTVGMLSKMLNTKSDTIKQLYYSHKSFRQARGENVKDIVFPPDIGTTNNVTNMKGSAISRQQSLHQPLQRPLQQPFQQPLQQPSQRSLHQPQRPNGISQNNLINKKNGQQDQHTNISSFDQNKMIGGRSIEEGKLKKLENENHMLEEIIKNYRMKRHLKKLYVDGKLDRKSIKYYKHILHKNNTHDV